MTGAAPGPRVVRLVFGRLMWIGVTLGGVLSITFVLARVLPGSPVEMMLGSRPTAEQIERVTRELHLDRPIAVQFAHFAARMLSGDLGQSLQTRQPVTVEIAKRMGATIELTTLATILVVLLGVPMGVVAALKHNRAEDAVATTASLLGGAMPTFLVGILLQTVFYGRLHWLPLQGRMSSIVLLDHPFAPVTGFYLVDTLLAGETAAFRSALAHLVLPVATLSLAVLPMIVRSTRTAMLEVLKSDHIRTARAFGLPPRMIHCNYALRATLIPLLTILGLTFGSLIGGAVVVEFLFDWPGIGGYFVHSIATSDFPATIGVTLFLATLFLLVNLIVDLLYLAADARLRV